MENNNFITELKALLEKYNASIGWECAECSDTHGIYNEHMVIEYESATRKEYITISGSGIDQFNIS